MCAVAACAAALVFAARATWQSRAEGARVEAAVARLGARLTTLESDGAALSARLATLARKLDAARSARQVASPHDVATSPAGRASSDRAETEVASVRDADAIRYAEDALSVHVAHASLADLLQEIGRQSGVRIRGQFDDARQVTADFTDVPLPEALHRLLGNQNFVLMYDDQHRPRELELVRAPEASRIVAPQSAAASLDE